MSLRTSPFARGLAAMHYRRFLREVIRIPCQILQRGGRLIFRLLARNQWTPLLTQGCAWLRNLPAAG